MQYQPDKIVNIKFGNSRFHSNVVRVSMPVPTSKEKHAFLTGLQTLFPQAAVLSIVFPKEDQSSSVTALTLPATLTSHYNPSCANMDESDLLKESEHVFETLSISHEEAEYLALSTRLQSKSLAWFEQSG